MPEARFINQEITNNKRKTIAIRYGFPLFELKNENGKYSFVNGNNPTVINPDEVAGFFEQTGKNTRYIVHPDEILPDNIRLLVLSKIDNSYIKNMDKEGLQLLAKIEGVLKE